MKALDWIDEAVYALADAFRRTCLLGDGSLLSAAADVTTFESVDALWAAVGTPDHGAGAFVEKLVRHVRTLPPAGVEVAAELLVIQLLGEDDTGGPLKVEHVESVLAVLDDPPPIPASVRDALHGGGVATYGAGKTRRDVFQRFLTQIVRSIKRLDAGERGRLLEDPWAFQQLVAGERTSTNAIQANALLHLLFPETFDTVVAGTHRVPLLRTFARAPGLAELPDDDHRIARLHALVTAQLGYEVTFYDELLEDIWNADVDAPFETYVEWALRLYGRTDFDANERDYKLTIAEALHRTATELERGGDWLASLRGALSAKENNLVSWRAKAALLEWCAAQPEAAGRALSELWSGEDVEATLTAFLELLREHVTPGAGTRLTLLSLLLLGDEPVETPLFRSTTYSRTLALLGREPAADERDPALPMYDQWYATLAELRLRLLTRGVELRDMIDAQGIAYWIAEAPAPADWDDETRAAFEHFRGGKAGEAAAGEDTASSRGRAAIPPVTPVLADRLNLPLAWLQETLDLLGEKGQLILYGPPGTGKTFVAKHLGLHLREYGAAVRTVQFHPSYTYEDFFEGYRPVTDADGALSYRLVPGPLRRLAADAVAAPDQLHLLIVDEINRGNLSKIFGELYYLLEYRDEAISLQYSPEQEFSLPPNLLLIGTMNTADRSIALVDSALRRRFYFRAMVPTRPPVNGVLRAWLERYGLDPTPADLLDALNDAIGDADFSIGPSFFMRADHAAPHVEHVWEHALMPLLEEHFFETGRDVAQEFGVDAMRARIERSVEDAAPDVALD